MPTGLPIQLPNALRSLAATVPAFAPTGSRSELPSRNSRCNRVLFGQSSLASIGVDCRSDLDVVGGQERMNDPWLCLTARRDGEVLVVAAEGTLTLPGMRQVAAETARELQLEDARAVLLDLRRPIHCLTEADWQQLYVDARGLRESISPPVMLVVPRACREPADKHCRKMARDGAVRLVASDFRVALSWCADWRVHWPWPPMAQAPSSARRAPAPASHRAAPASLRRQLLS